MSRFQNEQNLNLLQYVGKMKHNEVLATLQNLTGHKPTQQEIANILGKAVNSIGARAMRNSNYSVEELRAIGSFFNVDLFTKEPQISQYIDNLAVDFAKKKIQEIEEGKACVKVIYRPYVYLSAGYGNEVFDETAEYMMLDERLFITSRGTKINHKNCEIVCVSGNSMAPEYIHGDRVILDKSAEEFIDGQIFAFRYNGECFMKKIHLLGKRLKAESLNKDYEPFYIEQGEDVKVLGRIIPRVRL